MEQHNSSKQKDAWEDLLEIFDQKEAELMYKGSSQDEEGLVSANVSTPAPEAPIPPLESAFHDPQETLKTQESSREPLTESIPDSKEAPQSNLEEARRRYAIAQKAYGSIFRGSRKGVEGNFRFKSGKEKFERIQREYQEALQYHRSQLIEDLALKANELTPEEAHLYITKEILKYVTFEQEELGKLVRAENEKDLWNKFKGKWKNKSFVRTRLAAGLGMGGFALTNAVGLTALTLGSATVPLLIARGALGAVGTTLSLDAALEIGMNGGNTGTWVSDFKLHRTVHKFKGVPEDKVDIFINSLKPSDIKQELSRLYALEAQTGRKIEDVPQLFFKQNRDIARALVLGLKRYDLIQKQNDLESRTTVSSPEELKATIIEYLNRDIEERNKLLQDRLDRERIKKLGRRALALTAGTAIGIVAGLRVAKALDAVDATTIPSEELTFSKPQDSLENLGHIDKGETAGEVAIAILKSLGKDVNDVWSYKVELPDGNTIFLSELHIVHGGDKLSYIEDGGRGYFKFENTSGLRPQTEADVLNIKEVQSDKVDLSLFKPKGFTEGMAQERASGDTLVSSTPRNIQGDELVPGSPRGGDFEELTPGSPRNSTGVPQEEYVSNQRGVENISQSTFSGNLHLLYEQLNQPEKNSLLSSYLKEALSQEADRLSDHSRLIIRETSKGLAQNATRIISDLPKLKGPELAFLDEFLRHQDISKLPIEQQHALEDLKGYLRIRLENPDLAPSLQAEQLRLDSMSSSGVLEDSASLQRDVSKIPGPKDAIDQLQERIDSLKRGDIQEQIGVGNNLEQTVQEPNHGAAPIPPEAIPVRSLPISYEGLDSVNLSSDEINMINQSIYDTVIKTDNFTPEAFKAFLKDKPYFSPFLRPANIDESFMKFSQLFVLDGQRHDIVGSVNALAERKDRETLKFLKLILQKNLDIARQKNDFDQVKSLVKLQDYTSAKLTNLITQ